MAGDIFGQENNNKIDNRYVWGLSLVNILLLLACLQFPDTIIPTIIAFIIGWVLIAKDAGHLTSNGYKKPSVLLGVLFPSIYVIWRFFLFRGKTKPYYALGMLITTITLFTVLYQGGYQTSIEQTACSVVTNIIKDKDPNGMSCKAVKIDEKMSKDFYRARAVMDNGRILDITIEKMPNDMISVVIPPQ
ncbi:hypothetical protein ACNSO7_26255 [Yersinia enterocolitica]|uniref:hypothetical protein n=1 Tax=Yersinia enterocolitica TaxID=630 RepID=UPI0028B60E42|nr:hypothetical protein [Yersinia enterocolitica]HDM8092956.1 hypothetical protein [Yersinia enterocolitica]